MTGKLIVLALLGALVLVNVYGDDDFKKVDNIDEVEDMIEEIENDEESEIKQPRSPRFGAIFRLISRLLKGVGRTGRKILRKTRRRTRRRGGSNGKERKILLTLGNLGLVNWKGGTGFMKQGSVVETINAVVDEEDAVTLGAQKKPGPSKTGVSGVVCYRFKFIGKSFCVMFKVPYRGGNYWNVKVYNGAKQASGKIYNDLQKGAIKAGTPVAEKKIGEGKGFIIYMKDCTMTDGGQAILQVYIGVKEA